MVQQIEHWPDRVDALIARIGPPLRQGRVVSECDSTQDMARAMGMGSLVVAGRQVAGRGRREHRWVDTGSEGLAFSIVLQSTTEPECSVALAEAIAAGLLPLAPATVKKPNDVLLDGRKLAGVLVEQSGELAIIGIGINVHQREWPVELEETAISLHQGGVDIDRLEVLELLLPAVVAAWNG